MHFASELRELLPALSIGDTVQEQSRVLGKEKALSADRKGFLNVVFE